MPTSLHTGGAAASAAAAAATVAPTPPIPSVSSSLSAASSSPPPSASSFSHPHALIQPLSEFLPIHHIKHVDESYISNFEFKLGVSPLSGVFGVVCSVLLYVTVVRMMQRWVKVRGKPFQLKKFVIFHNSMLSILSGVLFCALVCQLYQLISQYGLWSVTCDPAGRHISGTIVFIYFINYIFKYLELIDTFLLALRGKSIPFLHIYHHAATLVLCWSQLWAQSCIQWLPIVINLLVHIIMYAYYALHAMGCHIWWKKYLTLLQITQFVVALVGCLSAFGSRFATQTLQLLPPDIYGCHGTYEGAYLGIGVIASYLYLFVVLYRQTYRSRKVKPTPSMQHHHTNGFSYTNGHVPTRGEETSECAKELHLE